MKKIKKINFVCNECGFKTWRNWKNWFSDANLTCPKCQAYGSLEERKSNDGNS